jgi:hypothetical protein
MWRGDFAEAQRHHAIAAHVHEQTELYVAGSGLVAEVTLLRELGGPVGDGLIATPADVETGGQGMEAMVASALLTIEGTRAEAQRRLRHWPATSYGAHVWVTLGQTSWLAHLAADYQLDEYAEALLAALEPFVDCIAVIGQVGLAGPVALATARLHALRGDPDKALADLAVAEDIGLRTGGRPTTLRCGLLRCQLAEDGPARRETARGLAQQAEALGMRCIAARALRLA